MGLKLEELFDRLGDPIARIVWDDITEDDRQLGYRELEFILFNANGGEKVVVYTGCNGIDDYHPWSEMGYFMRAIVSGYGIGA